VVNGQVGKKTRLGLELHLNGICPYFTMFPLDFPYGILSGHARAGQAVLDPFCGRGTTNFAARLLGLYSVGIDASPVAVAIAQAKLVSPPIDEIMDEARAILDGPAPSEVPTGEFWTLAYHPDVLVAICKFREAFLRDCTTPARIALRAILLGALHGPKRKTEPDYLSNQAPRTYAPKPRYAVRYWRTHGHVPENVNVLRIIERRAKRYFDQRLPNVGGTIQCADSRDPGALRAVSSNYKFDWIITSPPYYGMSTYIPDQWLRNWFVGGPATVQYTAPNQISHSSPETFVGDLRQVWRNVREVSSNGAHMIIRFGGVCQRKVDPQTLLLKSLTDTGWRVVQICDAGSARHGYRQADGFLKNPSTPVAEFDLWAVAV